MAKERVKLTPEQEYELKKKKYLYKKKLEGFKTAKERFSKYEGRVMGKAVSIGEAKVVSRRVLKAQPRGGIVLSQEQPRSKYFKQGWEAEKRNLLSWR